jgi:DNA-binding CsgD family transcriptional regulator
MKAIIFLLLYFLTYSAAFAGVTACAFARLRGGPAWLKLYLGWLVSAIGFMLLRNGGYFAKQYLGFGAIESTFAFYALYMVTTSLFLGFLACNSLYLVKGRGARVTRAVTALVAGIPILFIPLLFILGGPAPSVGLRLLLVNVMMYFAFAVVCAVVLFLFLSLKGMANRFARSIVHADLYAGAIYVVLSVAQWFTYYDKPYSLDPFCVVNVSLFVMFLASTVVIGREFLIEDKPESVTHHAAVAEPDGRDFLLDAKLTEKERRIVALIKRGATNQEIADSIGIKLSAVKSSIYRIFTRYGVSSRAGLIHALESRASGGADGNSDTTADPSAVSGEVLDSSLCVEDDGERADSAQAHEFAGGKGRSGY